MAQEVVQYCLTTLSALVTKHTYGSAVTVDGMCMTLTVPFIVMMRVLIVPDVMQAYGDRYWTGNFIDIKVFM
jgi:riboflavin synthase alpha subunit